MFDERRVIDGVYHKVCGEVDVVSVMGGAEGN
jgi:hypothetical protein